MHSLRLNNDPADIGTAASILQNGGLVAFPTETVFGLGADARQDDAVAKIYAAKGRPSFNPLIVHVQNVITAQSLTQWNDMAQTLADAFWPGPLTMVLPLCENHGLSGLVRAGLPTVAIRVPRHPIAQSLLKSFNGPIAAPSANPSGKISPTRAEHVLAGLDGKIDAVITAGQSDDGVESTIVSLAAEPVLLRPGSITQEQIETILGRKIRHANSGDPISAPGQLVSHYAPSGTLRMNATHWNTGEKRLGFGQVECDLNLSPSGNLTEAAANLFDMLHRIDARAGSTIAVSPIPNTGLGIAINDRLTRAAAPRD